MIGAAGAALTLTFSLGAVARAVPGWDGAIDAAFAILLGGGAVVLARRADDPRTDVATAAWIAAAAEASGLALHASLDGRIAPTAYGILALALAALAVRVGWRGFAQSAAAASLGSFAAILAPPVAAAAFAGHATWLVTAAIACGATLAPVAAWRWPRSTSRAAA